MQMRTSMPPPLLELRPLDIAKNRLRDLLHYPEYAEALATLGYHKLVEEEGRVTTQPQLRDLVSRLLDVTRTYTMSTHGTAELLEAAKVADVVTLMGDVRLFESEVDKLILLELKTRAAIT